MPALLNCISYYSLLRGVLSPRQLCHAAKSLGFNKIALTDFNNLYGWPELLRQCKELELIPICAAYLADNTTSALLYAHQDVGYKNLCRIISDKHCKKGFSLLDSIHAEPSGIHVVTDSIILLRRLRETVAKYYALYAPTIPPVEIRTLKIPALFVPCAAFRTPSDITLHKLLRAIDQNTTLSRLTPETLLGMHHLIQSPQSLDSSIEVFDYVIDATNEFMSFIDSRATFGTPIMPQALNPVDALETLRTLTMAGAKKRYPVISPAIEKRIEYELGIIAQKGFAEYFLIVEDIVKQSPRTCGRGSAAASIVSYCIGITNVDPIRYNLMFERFLNPGRVDPPDIDIDFAWDERDGVLDYVFAKYGTEHAAMVATHLTFGLRMAVREVARVFGMTESEISLISKKLPYFYNATTEQPDIARILRERPKSKDIILDKPWPEILSLAERLIGIPCGIGTHCGGVVVTAEPISHHAPIQYSAKGYPIVQWEKDGAEEMGLVKIDLLGNRSLAVIRDAIKNIKNEDITFSEHGWSPADDQETVNTLAHGRTMGVFYVESPAMRLLQEKTGVGDFEHMVIHSSIIRPAANKYIREYIKRLHGEPYTLDHPMLADILKETYGIMVYQEDVAKVAVGIAGFSYVDADGLRKAISKKARAKRLEDYQRAFFLGARHKGVADESIEAIWSMMMSFRGYSFCKPHSASYVKVSFQSAYLKTHFPAAFMAAVISNFGGFYTTQAYISEAQRLGLTITAPDINLSQIQSVSRGQTIIIGLSLIKGLTQECQQKLVNDRAHSGLFASLDDFCQRTQTTEADCERLIFSGALDTLVATISTATSAPKRPQLFWELRRYFRAAGMTAGGRKAPPLAPYSSRQLYAFQYRALGFLADLHPIELARPSPPMAHSIPINAIGNNIGKRVCFYGWCVTSRTLSTVNGDGMEFATFEDETALIETVLFPQAHQTFSRYIAWQEGFLIQGLVSADFGVAVVEVDLLRPIRELRGKT